MAGTIDRAANEFDRLTGAQERNEKQAKATQESAKKLRAEYEAFHESIRKGEKSSEDAVFGLRRLAGEMDKLARKRPIGDSLGDDLNRSSQAARRAIAEIQEIDRVERKWREQEIKDSEQVRLQRIRESHAIRELRDDVEMTMRNFQGFHDEVERGQHTAEAARAGYRQFGNELSSLQRKFSAGSDDALRLGEASEEARMHASRMRTEVRELGHEVDRTGGLIKRLFSADPDRVRELDELFDKFERSVAKNRFSVAALDNRLRGLVYLGVIVFFQQLVSLTGVLAGAFISLASTAVQAGIAIGGTFASGIAQAVPMIGLLISAFGRVGAVFKAVEQAQKAALQAGQEQTAAMDRQRQSAEQVRNAQEGVADAQRRVTEATEALTRAREEAQRQLEDLLRTERDAKRGVGRSVAAGDVDALEENQLRLRRTREDLTRVGRDPNRMPGVVAAERQLEEAERAAKRARSELRGARDDATRAAAEVGAATTALNQLLGELNPTERRLYESVRRLQETYKRLFRPITDIIVGAFADSVDRIEEVLGDERIVGTLARLADRMADSIRTLTEEFTSGPWLDFFERMGTEAERNLGPLTDIAINLSRLFRNIADAASPALRELLDFLSDLISSAADATAPGSGMSSLQEFFMQGEKYTEDFIKLGIAIADLFLALVGASSESGQTAIQDFTAEVQKATLWIESHQEQVVDFFEDARKVTYMVASAIWALVEGLAELYHPESVALLAQAFEETFLPALIEVAKVVGLIATAFLKLSSTPIGGAIVEFALITGLLVKTMRPLAVLMSSFLLGFARLASLPRMAAFAMTAFNIATGPTGKLIAAIVAAIVIAAREIEPLGDALDWLGNNLELVLPLFLLFGSRLRGLVGAAGLISTLTTALGGLRAAFYALSTGRGIGAAIAAMRDYITASRTARALPPPGGPGIPPGGAASGAMTRRGMAGQMLGRAAVGLGTIAIGTMIVRELIGADSPRNRILPGLRDEARRTQRSHDPLSGILAPDATSLRESLQSGFIDRALGTFNDSSKIDEIADSLGGVEEKIRRLQEAGNEKGLRNLADDLEETSKQLSGDRRRLVEEYARAVRQLAVHTDDSTVSPDDILNQETLERVRRNLDRLRDFGVSSIRDLRERMARNIDRITDAVQKGSGTWLNLMARNFGAGIAAIRQGMRDGTISTDRGFKEINRIVRDNMRFARNNMDRLSWEGKQKLANNFAGAAEAVAAQMSRAERATEKGMKRIRTLYGQSLRLYGFDEKAVDRYSEGRDPLTGKTMGEGGFGGRGMATGGFVGMEGERGQDSWRHTVHGRPVGRGEAVLGWPHQKVINPILGLAKAFGISPYGSIGDVFRSVRGYHAGGPGVGFSGGYAGRSPSGNRTVPIPGFPGEFIAQSVLREAMSYIRRFRLFVTDAFATAGHVGAGHLQTGTAMDVVPGRGGSWNLVDRAVAAARRAGLTVLYDGVPNHGRGYHAHIELQPGRAAGGDGHALGLADEIRKIRRVAVEGMRDSALKDIAQAAINRVRGAANRRLDGITGDTNVAAIPHPAFRGDWVKAMRALAREHGWDLGAWKTLVQKESGGDPTAVNPSSGAFGLGQFLGATARAYAKFGALSRNPVRQIQAMAQYIMDRYRNPTRALAFHLANNWYARGGEVPGTEGQAVPIMAHAKEWVVNKMQQSKLASWLGMPVDKLRGSLGFTGGPASFQGGGEVAGVYERPIVPPRSVRGIFDQIQELFEAITGLGDKAGAKGDRRVSKTIKLVTELVHDGGLLDQLNDAVDRRVTGLNTALALSLYRIRSGRVIRREPGPTATVPGARGRRDDFATSFARQELDVLEETTRLIRRTMRVDRRGLAEVRRMIQRVRRGGVDKNEIESYQALITTRNNLLDRISASNQALAQNIEARYSKQIEIQQARIESINERFGTRLSQIGNRMRRHEIRGLAAGGGGAFDLIRAQQGAQESQLGELQRVLRRTRDPGLRRELMQQIDDLKTSILETSLSFVTEMRRQIDQRADRRNAFTAVLGRIAEALGQKGIVNSLITSQIESARTQVGELQSALKEAQRRGLHDQAAEIQQQIWDLNASIVEMGAAQLQGQIDIINDAAQRRNARIGLINRIADLQQRAGAIGTAFAFREAGLREQGAGMRVDRDALSNLLMQAMLQGNVGQVQALRDQIAELDVAIAENTLAIDENTVAARQAAIDRIMSRGTFLGGVFGELGSLVTALGSISGNANTGLLSALLGQAGTTLNQTGSGLRQQLFEAFGIDVRGLDPMSLTEVLRSLNYDGIEANFSVDQRQQFESLISAIIENATVVAQNTEQLNQLNNPNLQSWSSTAWRWFRNAVFTGAGGLLPQYQIPAMNTGGRILSDGLVYGHAGEEIVRAAIVDRRNSGGDEIFAPEFHVVEQVEEADPEVLANRMMWRYQNRPKSRRTR